MTPLWTPPPADGVHLWLLDLDVPRRLLPALRATLSDEERARADAFLFAPDSLRYAACHGLLRRVLAGYLGVAPAGIAYSVGRHGKPGLDPAHGSALRFNLSHSLDLGVCAVAVDREVGVDVERIRTDRDHAGLAERWFSPAERAAVRSLPRERRVRAFYDCWTRKEAYVKARGDGLFLALDSFDVTADPDQPAALVRSAAGEDEPDRWRMIGFTPVRGFAGALAVEGAGWTAVAVGPPPPGSGATTRRVPEVPR